MIENKLPFLKSILIFVAILAVFVAALNVADYFLFIKKTSPTAVQTMISPTITPIADLVLEPTVMSAPEQTNITENFKIAYSLADGIYIANSDGTFAQKVFNCPNYKSGSNGNCSVPFWLKDGRLISNITNGKRINIGQDFIDDTNIVIIGLINNDSKIILRPNGYNNYNWNFNIDNLIMDDPLMLSQKEADNKYYLFNPDKESAAEIFKQEVSLSGKSYFYFSNDTLTYDYGNKSEYVPNKNGDTLLVNEDLSCQVSVYNVQTKKFKNIFDDCDRGKITIIADKKYELLKQGSCKLSQNSSYIACSMEDFAHIGGDHLLLLVDLKNNSKAVLPLSHWSFQFSPDNKYLYLGSIPDNGASGVASVSRYNIVNKSLENVISSVQSSGNATWIFALSSLIENN